MLGFLRRRKKSSDIKSRVIKTVDSFQKPLESFKSEMQEKIRPVFQLLSVNNIEGEVGAELKSFRSYVKLIKDTSVRIDELTKLLKSGEIPENAYKLLMDELGAQLSLAVEDIFRSREVLELDRAKAKVEWAKAKIGLKEVSPENQPSRPGFSYEAIANHEDYSELSRWKDIVSRIDSTLSSLTIEEEASIIEQYLSLIKERFAEQTKSDEIEKAIATCRQRLSLISGRWSSIRRSKIEQIINLELESSRLNDEIKELEVRFAVGELEKDTYEHKTGDAQGLLKKNERETSSVRGCIDEMDMKMFRCGEMLR